MKNKAELFLDRMTTKAHGEEVVIKGNALKALSIMKNEAISLHRELCANESCPFYDLECGSNCDYMRGFIRLLKGG